MLPYYYNTESWWSSWCPWKVSLPQHFTQSDMHWIKFSATKNCSWGAEQLSFCEENESWPPEYYQTQVIKLANSQSLYVSAIELKKIPYTTSKQWRYIVYGLQASKKPSEPALNWITPSANGSISRWSRAACVSYNWDLSVARLFDP